MQITGIEVIRRNLGVAAGVVAGEKIELTYGDTLRVNVSFDYRGLGMSVRLYGAIGQVYWPTGRFDPILQNEVSIDLPESMEFTPCERSVDIPITSDISPKSDYDLRVKFPDYLEAGQPIEHSVIDIVGIPPTYELIQETIYPWAYVYDGDVEVTTATFKTDPFTPAAWAAEKFAKAVADEVEKEGGRVIELKVYVDKTPLLWTNFRIEVIGTPLGGAVSGIAVGIPFWAAILIIALAIIAVIVVATLAFETVMDRLEHKPLSEKIKKAMSRETLITLINDFEIKLEHTPIPVSELEEMSDQELRDYCDQLAEEIAPPEISPWAIVALAGGLGILGVGAVVALSAARPGE